MPSVSKKQHNLMSAVANNPQFAKKVGIKQSVGKEFLSADKGKKFSGGGEMKKLFKGKETAAEEMKEAKALKSGKISKAQYVAGEKSEGHGKGAAKTASAIKSGKISPAQYAKAETMKKGGVAKTVTKEMEYDYKTGKKSFAGTTAQRDRHAEKEGKIVAKHLAYDKDKDAMKRGGSIKKMASGGLAAGHKSADGIATKGKTKARAVTMCGGGRAKGK